METRSTRRDAPGFSPQCSGDGLEIQLARRIARNIFGGDGHLEIVPIEPASRLTVLGSRSGWLNWVWRFHRWFPGMEMFVVENGSVPEANGVKRADYLRSHLHQVEQALAAGVPVKGYNYWSITSNREWGHAFDPNTDFGLLFVDLDRDPSLQRVPTADVQVYQEIIRSRSVQSSTPSPEL